MRQERRSPPSTTKIDDVPVVNTRAQWRDTVAGAVPPNRAPLARHTGVRGPSWAASSDKQRKSLGTIRFQGFSIPPELVGATGFEPATPRPPV
ncbi:hypothetical protein [Azospirillum sp. B510]|uniref:hypothetical protein n=1 Tax=Azospirillum sp. (strain B510) TaxID=137722 RepID=UPI003527E703